MLQLLHDINYTLNKKFERRVGLRKGVYTIITETLMFTPKDILQNIFLQGSPLEKKLEDLFISYQKRYSMGPEALSVICKDGVNVVNDFCNAMNERTAYSGNFYNEIDHRYFTRKILNEAFKDEQH